LPADTQPPQVQQADSSDIGDTSGVPELIAAPSIELDNENLPAAENEGEDPGQSSGTAEFAALVPTSPEASEQRVRIGDTDELDQASESLEAERPVTEVKSATDEHQLEENS
jgi:hypothetical protein